MIKPNSKVSKVKGSATISITMRANELKAEGKNVISLAAGQTDFDTPQHIKNACIEALNAGKTKYTPPDGTLPLRKAISEKFKKDNNLDYPVNQIVVSCGAKHSLYNIFQLILEDGDEVIIPQPYWVSYPEFVTLAGGESVFVQTAEENNFLITPEQLENAITPKTKAVVLNSPSNPTGMAYDIEALKSLGEVLKKHPQIAIVSDEIYEDLTYGGFKHTSFATVVPELFNRTFTVNGFSKTFSMTGWRLGYTGCPNKETAGAMKKIQAHSTTGVTSFVQDGGVAALVESKACVEEMLKAFNERRNYIVNALNEITGVKCLNPQGAFYVFPNISAWGIPSMELATRLLEEVNIAVIPGVAFGADENIRISFALSLEDLKEAVSRLKKWVAENVN